MTPLPLNDLFKIAPGPVPLLLFVRVALAVGVPLVGFTLAGHAAGADGDAVRQVAGCNDDDGPPGQPRVQPSSSLARGDGPSIASIAAVRSSSAVPTDLKTVRSDASRRPGTSPRARPASVPRRSAAAKTPRDSGPSRSPLLASASTVST